MQLSFRNFLLFLLKRSLIISISTIMVMCIFYSISKYLIPPSYTATAQLFVNNQQSIKPSDISALEYSQKIVNTYICFLNTNAFYNNVIDESGLPYTSMQLNKCTSIVVLNNTEIFQISVTTNSANDSYKLVYTMENLAPEFINHIKNSSDLLLLDPVIYNPIPSSPNIYQFSCLGALIGCSLSLGFILLWQKYVSIKSFE